jgi:hypothetical protein
LTSPDPCYAHDCASAADDAALVAWLWALVFALAALCADVDAVVAEAAACKAEKYDE